MNNQKIMDALCAISGLDEDQLAAYQSLIDINAALVEDDALSPEQQQKLEMLVAAKTNYEIVLCGRDDISSFSAADVKITKNGQAGVECAKAIYDMALEDAADCMGDRGFAFMGV